TTATSGGKNDTALVLLGLQPAASSMTTYSYDSFGDRTTITPPSGPATSLGYDQLGRLTSYGSSVTYAYNGDGRRMSKTVSATTTQETWNVLSSVPEMLVDGAT